LAENGQRMRDAVMHVFESTQCGGDLDHANQTFGLPRVWNC
jgi:hypothetical protein